MIRRLVDAHYQQFSSAADEKQVRFWLAESRSPELLRRVADRYPDQLRAMVSERPLLQAVIAADDVAVHAGLPQEEAAERTADQEYWRPLRSELESLGLSRPDERDR